MRQLTRLLVIAMALTPSAFACAPVSAKSTEPSAEPNAGADRKDTATPDAGDEKQHAPHVQKTDARKLVVTFFDVGQGDSALVQTPSGKTILIDGGPPEAGPVLVEKLKAMGIEALDLVIASHPHADHIGGLVDVVRAFKVRAFLDSGVAHTTPTFRDYLAEVERQKEKNGAKFWVARKGRTIRLDEGAVVVEVLAPEEPLLFGTRSDVNSNSVVVRLTYESAAFLFTGDAEAGTEERLVKQSDKLRVSVLKVAHHGSRHSTTPEFLRAVQPDAAVISCGRGNSYGHPKPKTLKALEAVAKVYRTDRDGTVIVTTDGKALEYKRLGVVERPQEGTPIVIKGAAYVASRRAKTFHRSDCPGAAKIRAANRVNFGSWGEAAASGRKPHRGCMP
ncbi:MAG: MBL fold metallo-hydrolase [Deltaproteobacteria bacterium]|nr:MBL fold metallo-hydrolase [Deltaproteobacteria bacterium]